MEVAHWLCKETELPALLPFSFRDVRLVAFQATSKREDQGEGMFGNRVAGIAPDIGDDDAAFEAGDDIGFLAVRVTCPPVFAGGPVQGNAGTDGVTVEMNDIQACHV